MAGKEKRMKSGYQMTKQEAQEEIASYKKIFSVVRLLSGQDIEKLKAGKLTGSVSKICQCYKFWNKNSPCANCISLKVWEEKSERTKLEFQDDDIYQVISRYVEIDGTPYVMELVKKMDEENLLDADGRKKAGFPIVRVQ